MLDLEERCEGLTEHTGFSSPSRLPALVVQPLQCHLPSLHTLLKFGEQSEGLFLLPPTEESGSPPSGHTRFSRSFSVSSG